MKEVNKEDILKNLNSPIIQALNDQGITPSYLAEKLKEELNAKQTKVFQHQGEVIYSADIPALEIQQRARMDAHKLLDHYPKEKIEVEGTIFQVMDYAKKKEDV